MKEYGDEDFIFLIQQEEEMKHPREEHVNKIQDGFIILQEETVPFARVSISTYGFSMLVPEAFDEMPESMIIAKYTDLRRPQYVLSSPKTTMNLAFRYEEEDDLLPEETEQARDVIWEALKKARKLEEVNGCQTFQAGEMKVASFDFISPARDSDLYNLMFFFPLQGKLMIGTFNCLAEKRYDWSEIAGQMIASIQMDVVES